MLCYMQACCRGWVEAVDRRAATVQERLEGDLNGYKNNMIKESIRMGHHELVCPGTSSRRCHAGLLMPLSCIAEANVAVWGAELHGRAGGTAGTAQGASLVARLGLDVVVIENQRSL